MGADELDALLPELAPFLRMLCSGADSEIVTAIKVIRKRLAAKGLDFYALLERIEGYSEAEVIEIRDKAYANGIQEGVEQGRRNAVATTTTKQPFFSSSGFDSSYFNGSYSNSGGVSNLNGGRADGNDTFHGFPLRNIAQHCAANLSRIPGKHHGFVEGMADQLEYDTISEAQAKYLCSLFTQHFGGRI